MAAVVIAVAVLLGLFWSRLRVLGRWESSFPCAIRTDTGWASGMACYRARELRWYRVISLVPGPRYVWSRATFALAGPAVPIVDDDEGVPARVARPARGGAAGGALVAVTCEVSPPGRPQERSTVTLALSADAYAGLASWLESAPPGLTTAPL